MIFFSQGGGQPISTVCNQGSNQSSPLLAKSLSRSLSPLGEASKLPRQIQSAQLCTVPSPFTARFQGTLVADDVTTVIVPEE